MSSTAEVTITYEVVGLHDVVLLDPGLPGSSTGDRLGQPGSRTHLLTGYFLRLASCGSDVTL